MEIKKRLKAFGGFECASMGPSPERDGNDGAGAAANWIKELQWGHPLKGMEISIF